MPKAITIYLIFLMSVAPSFNQLVQEQASFNTSVYNWEFMNANSFAQNYIPQNQINSNTVNELKPEWIFALPASEPVSGLNSTGEGAIAPPLLVNGTIYLLTNSLNVFAINSINGNLVWRFQASINRSNLPLGYLMGHMHGMNYYRGYLWISLPDCSIIALDANTGLVKLQIKDICSGIPGNAGYYVTRGTAPVFYKNELIVGSSVSESTDAGRGFVAAYDIDSGTLLWRWYITPPAGGDPLWDFDSCSLPCRGNVNPVYGDWGNMGFNGSTSLSGAGTGWGQFAVDSKKGIVYIATSQPSPDWNATNRPGPDLYSDSIVALNATDGKMIWFYQTTPHDMYDFDCGWNVVLGNVTISGEVVETVFKACKNGYLYALNAYNGSLIWYFNPPNIVRVNTDNADYVKSGFYNGTIPWPDYPSLQEYLQCPGINGGIESDIAYAYGNIYVAAMNLCYVVETSSVSHFEANSTGLKYSYPLANYANTTIYCLNASTGRIEWSFPLSGIPFRGWLTVSGGLLYVSALDGDIHILSALSGNQVGNIHVGPSLYEGPVIGSSLSGDIILLQLVSSTSYYGIGSGTPGVIIAYGISRASQPNNYSTEYMEAIVIVALSIFILIRELMIRSKRRVT